MNITQNILSYLFATLPDAEKQAWESELIHNADLKRDIKELRQLFQDKKITDTHIWEQATLNPELEKWVQEVEKVIRRIKHRDFQLAFIEGVVSSQEQAEYDAAKETQEDLAKSEKGLITLSEMIRAAKYVNTVKNIAKTTQFDVDWDEIEKGLGRNIPNKPTSSSRPLWQQNWFRMAASLLLLAVVGLGIWKIISPKEHDAQYYANTYLAQPYPISGSMGKGDDLEQLIGLYQAGEYATVAEKLEKAPISEPKAQMMQANCYLKLQKWEAAKALFITLQSHNKYGKDAQFYLALTYTFQGNKTQAIKELEALKPQTLEGELKQKVTSLLKDLKGD
ncbi:MAG: tetratricopeptide repeat protein [Bacteroidia bacterium]